MRDEDVFEFALGDRDRGPGVRRTSGHAHAVNDNVTEVQAVLRPGLRPARTLLEHRVGASSSAASTTRRASWSSAPRPRCVPRARATPKDFCKRREDRALAGDRGLGLAQVLRAVEAPSIVARRSAVWSARLASGEEVMTLKG